MNTLNKILFGVAAVMVLVSGIFMVKARNKEKASLHERLRADSIAASNDTLRIFSTMDKRVLKQLGDSLQIVTQQIAQGNPGRGVASGSVSSRANVSGQVKGLSEVSLVPMEEDSHRFNVYLKR